jgi:hypothetical protein
MFMFYERERVREREREIIPGMWERKREKSTRARTRDLNNDAMAEAVRD